MKKMIKNGTLTYDCSSEGTSIEFCEGLVKKVCFNQEVNGW